MPARAHGPSTAGADRGLGVCRACRPARRPRGAASAALRGRFVDEDRACGQTRGAGVAEQEVGIGGVAAAEYGVGGIRLDQGVDQGQGLRWGEHTPSASTKRRGRPNFRRTCSHSASVQRVSSGGQAASGGTTRILRVSMPRRRASSSLAARSSA